MIKTFLALLVVAVIAGIGPGIAAGPVAAQPLDPGATLLQQVPTSLRGTCKPAAVNATANGADAALACTPRRVAPTRVAFLGFADAASARARYIRDGDLHKIPRDTNGDCFGYTDSESPFLGRDGVSGRFFCARRDHSIEWTYGNVVARATGTNDNDLYTWWAHLVGRTLNPTQRALFAQAPTGIDRTICQDNGDASIKCASPAATLYVVKYTRFPTAESLMAAYTSTLAGSKLALSNPPPRSRKTVCTFETTWTSTSTKAVLGRVACFHGIDGTDHFLWTIDSQLTLVEASGPSRSDVTAFFKTFPMANQTARLTTR